MSLLAKQTIKSSIYSYIGVIIGYFTTVHLMPEFLSTSEIGNIRLIQNYARLFGNLLLLGIPLTTIRVFPKIESIQSNHNGFATFLFLAAIFCSSLFAVLFFPISRFAFQAEFEKSILFSEYFYFVLPFTIFLIFFNLFDAYTTALKQSSFGVFLRDFVFRVGFLSIIVLFGIGLFSYKKAIIGLGAVEFALSLSLILFLILLKQLKITKKITVSRIIPIKELIRQTGFNWLSSISQMAVIMVDTLMIGKMIGDTGVGVYSTYFYMVSIMLIPSRSLLKISGPVLSDAFNQNNLQRVEEIFKKSANNQFISGGFIYFNLLIGLPVIYQLLGIDFETGLFIIPFIGLGYIFKLSTGIKAKIVATSAHYHLNTYLTQLFIVLLIVTNFIGIKHGGLTGAALATMISSVLYDISSLMVVKRKFNLTPWSFKLLKSTSILTVLAIGFIALSLTMESIWISILTSIVFSSLYGFIAIKLNLSDDITAIAKRIPLLKKLT